LGTLPFENMENKAKKTLRKAYIEIISGIILLGTGPMFVKYVRANGVLVALYRLLFAALMLAIPALLSGRKSGNGQGRKGENIWLLAGGAAFAVNIALWSSALNHTSAAIVTVLDNTAPVWVGIFAWVVFRKRQGKAYWIGLCLAVAGGFMLVYGREHPISTSEPLGIVLSLLSGISYAGYILITQQARQQHSALMYSWMVSAVGAIILLVFGLFSGVLDQVLPARSFVLIFLMALSSQVLGWYLVNDALGKLPPAAGAVTLVGQPIVTTILGIFILNELLSVQQWIGAAMCLGGILLAQRRKGSA